jgi:hypothetical protein
MVRRRAGGTAGGAWGHATHHKSDAPSEHQKSTPHADCHDQQENQGNSRACAFHPIPLSPRYNVNASRIVTPTMGRWARSLRAESQS